MLGTISGGTNPRTSHPLTNASRPLGAIHARSAAFLPRDQTKWLKCLPSTYTRVT
jgi:hypothetical protein